MNITDFCLISLFVMIFKISFKTIKSKSYASQTLILLFYVYAIYTIYLKRIKKIHYFLLILILFFQPIDFLQF